MSGIAKTLFLSVLSVHDLRQHVCLNAAAAWLSDAGCWPGCQIEVWSNSRVEQYKSGLNCEYCDTVEQIVTLHVCNLCMEHFVKTSKLIHFKSGIFLLHVFIDSVGYRCATGGTFQFDDWLVTAVLTFRVSIAVDLLPFSRNYDAFALVACYDSDAVRGVRSHYGNVSACSSSKFF